MKEEKTKVVAKKEEVKTGRRTFLKTAAAGAAGVAALGFPMVSRAQTVTLKMQGAWGAKDIFNEYAEDYVKRVNEMAGGRLKIDYLVAGAVVKPFQVMDAVNKGVLDAGHRCPSTGTGRARWRRCSARGPSSARTPTRASPGSITAAARQLYDELLKALGLNIVGVLRLPDADPASRVVQEADHGRQGSGGPQVPHRGPGGRPVPGDGQ